MEYREFTCIVCGAKGIDRSTTQTRKYCSENCASINWHRMRGVGTYIKTPSCVHNREIRCFEKKCSTCGWNPKVEMKRKEALAYG